jgi:ammonium transporter, Amt family
VQGWAAVVMGIVSGSRGRCPSTPTMNRCRRGFLQEEVDDTLGILHTHAVSGLLGGVLTGVFAHPALSDLFLPVTNSRGLIYGVRAGGAQILKQVVAACFVVGWNVVVTSAILVVVRALVPLRMTDEQLARRRPRRAWKGVVRYLSSV